MNNDAVLRFESQITDIRELSNPSFASATLRVCYTGRNRNGSYISREAIEGAIPTIYNCPIVCNYDIESDTIGGHDMKYVEGDDGQYRLINLTDAVGVIPDGASYSFVTVEDKGVKHEYFDIDAILWKRAPVFQKLERDGVCAESMEIHINSGAPLEGDEKYYDIKSFNFEAFCLLGDDVVPCFESAGIKLYQRADFESTMQQMLAEYKSAFSKVTTSTDEADINITEGGNPTLDINAILAKFNLTVEQLDFDYSGMTEEEIEREIQSRADNENFGLTNSELTEEMYAALAELGTITEHDWWDDADYEIPRYGYIDRDPSTNTVIVYDRKEGYILYGFTYSMNGDHVVIDPESKKRKRVEYVDFNEGDNVFSVKSIAEAEAKSAVEAYGRSAEKKFAEEREVLNGKIAEANARVEKLTGDVNNLTGEVKTLSEYKAGIVAAQRKQAEGDVFSRFADLEGNEAFESLKTNCSDMEIADIEEKCFAIRGRLGTKFSLEDKNKPPRLSVGNIEDDSDEPYGGIIKRYKENLSRH